MAALQHRLRGAGICGNLYDVQACLAAGADPNAGGELGCTPLHLASMQDHTDCVVALIAGGANPCAAATDGQLPAHSAAADNRCLVLRQLAAANPSAVALRDSRGRTPLQEALCWARLEAARTLLTLAPRQPAAELLRTIKITFPHMRPCLYALVAAHQPLSPAEWALIPTPCPCLGTALPAVLQRSTAEARLLVQHLPADDRTRLRTFALCLWRAQRFPTTVTSSCTTTVTYTTADSTTSTTTTITTTVKHSVVLPPLPTDIVWRLLAQSVA